MESERIHVLLVEDDRADARLVELTLREDTAGRFSVRHVATLADAFEALARPWADVVLLDLSLPDSHGLATVEAVRAAAPALPIIVLTGVDDTEFAVATAGAGAQDYLVKGQADGSLMLRAIRSALIRRRLEERARASEERFRNIVTLATDAIIVIDGAQRVVLFNPAAERMFGWRAEEIIGRPVSKLIPEPLRITHTQHVAEFLVAPDAARRLERPGGDLHGLRRDGREFPVELSVSKFSSPDGVLFTAMVRDVTEQRRAQHALERQAAEMCALAERLDAALAQAEAGSRAKSEFLAMMSHEIRTPLNGVLGMTRLLLDGPLTEEQRRRVEIIVDSGEALLAILNDVLDYSKLEAGRVELERVDFDLRRAVNSTVALMSSRAEERGLSLTTALDGNLPRVLVGDVGRLRQILLNLVGNAVKFTERGGVRVVADALPGSDDATIRLRVSVLDTGIGIAPEVLKRLFGSFVQADASISRRFGGSGLGLSICRRLVELMGGTIGVDSEPGRGSRFWFEVPFGIGDAFAPCAPTPVSLPDGSTPRRALAILLAEDDAINREVALGFIERQGHRVTVVGDGASAVEAVEQSSFDLVLMDVQMPVMDGEEATRRIRSLSGTAGRVPIIGLTGSTLEEEVARFRAAGMDGVVGKPVRPHDLFAEIARVLGLDGRYGAPVPTGAEADDGVIDRVQLASLREALPPDVYVDIVVGFESESRTRLVRMLAALQDGDLDGCRREAHDFKSNAANFGLRVLAELVQSIEQSCRVGDAATAGSLCAIVEPHLERALAALKAETTAPA